MKEYKYKVQGVDYEVNIKDIEGNVAIVTVNGKEFEVEMNHPFRPVQRSLSKPLISTPPPHTSSPVQTIATPQLATKTGTGIKVKSPLPGVITNVGVTIGQQVKKGDVVVVLEAMKMQNNIEAENSGSVTSILVNKGDSVMEGTILLTIG
jgi:glutaconyl-CoA/methylmalonyl-CoA decarboxylase subunit gamma